MQRVDRELHLEFAESRINPAFNHMSSPIPNICDPLFYLKINGEALWKWRELKMGPTQYGTCVTHVTRLTFEQHFQHRLFGIKKISHYRQLFTVSFAAVFLRPVFTSDGVVVEVVIRSVKRYDLVKIKPTESAAEH